MLKLKSSLSIYKVSVKGYEYLKVLDKYNKIAFQKD